MTIELKRFADLIRFLETEIDWEIFDSEQNARIEQALLQVRDNPQILTERLDEIDMHPEVLEELIPHVEFPRALMDKFPIYLDPQDRFRIRIHRWRSKLLNKGARPESPHNHRWNFSSLILSGEYIQHTYEPYEVNEEQQTARLRTVTEAHFTAGDVHSMDGEIVHNVMNPSEEIPCITLFIRGKSIRGHSTVYQPEVGKFFHTYGQAKGIRHELKQIKDLILQPQTL